MPAGIGSALAGVHGITFRLVRMMQPNSFRKAAVKRDV